MFERAGEHHRLARYRALRRHRLHRPRRHMPEQRVERFLIVRLGEEIGDGLGDDLANPFDIVDFRARLRALGGDPARRAQRLERAEMTGEAARIGLADMADAERIDEAVQQRFPRRARSR